MTTRTRPRPAAAPVGRRPSDSTIVTATLAAIGLALAFVRIGAQGAAAAEWSYQVVMLFLVAAAVAGRLLLGYREEPQQEPSRRLEAWAPWLIFLAGVLPYLLVLGVGFLADDWWIGETMAKAHGPLAAWRQPVTPHMYRPLSGLLWWLQARVSSGAVDNHLVSALLHGATAVLVYGVGRRLIRSAASALLAGLLFAWQPIHAEPVVWLGAQADVECALCVLLSLLALSRYLESRRIWALLAAAGAYALALFAKEAGAALPAVALVWVWLTSPVEEEQVAGGRRRRTLLLVGGAYGLALGLYLAARTLHLHGIGGYEANLSFWNTLFPSTPLRQMLTFFVPVNQALTGGAGGLVLFAPVALLCIAGLVWCLASLSCVPGRRLGLYGATLVLLALPVWSYTWPGPDLSTSRCLYLPTVPLCWLVGEVLHRRRWGIWSAAPLVAALALLLWGLAPWLMAGRTARAITAAGEQMVQQAPPGPGEPAFYVEGLPMTWRGAEVFAWGFPSALRATVKRPVIAYTVGSEVPREALSVRPLLPREYRYAWDGDTQTLRPVREAKP